MALSVVYFRFTHHLGRPHYVWDEYLYSVLQKVEVRETVCVTVLVSPKISLNKSVSSFCSGLRVIYKTLIRPLLMYGSETWTLSQVDMTCLSIFERKILRKITGLVQDNGNWRIRYNEELHPVYKSPDIIKTVSGSWCRPIINLQYYVLSVSY